MRAVLTLRSGQQATLTLAGTWQADNDALLYYLNQVFPYTSFEISPADGDPIITFAERVANALGARLDVFDRRQAAPDRIY